MDVNDEFNEKITKKVFLMKILLKSYRDMKYFDKFETKWTIYDVLSTLSASIIEIWQIWNKMNNSRRLEHFISFDNRNMASKFDILDFFVPNAILSEIFSQLLSLEDICQFDSAISNVQ
jgi:hypothetical protein